MRDRFSLLLHKDGFILLLLFLAIIPYVVLAFYCHPIADDFAYAYKGKTFPYLKALLHEFTHWNGRYSSNLFVLKNPMVFDTYQGYQMAPIAIIVATLLSWFFFVRSLLPNVLDVLKSWTISAFISLLYLYQLPILSEGIYWFTGAVTYQLGNIVALLYIGMLLRFLQKKYLFNISFIHGALLVLLLVFSIGFNEVLMLSMWGFSGIVLGISVVKKQPHIRLFLSLFLVSSLCSAFVILAPGNAGRASYYSQAHQFLPSLIASFMQTLRFVLEWISSVPLILGSIFYYYANKRWSEKVALFSASFHLKPMFSLGLIFFGVFVCIFPAYWSTGMLGQHRTINVAYFIFLLLWFVNLTVWFNYYGNRGVVFQPLKGGIRLLFLCLIYCSFLFTKNGMDITTDIAYGRLSTFNQQMKKRYVQLKSADKHQEAIYMDLIDPKPKSLFVADIFPEPDYWINRAYAIFFELENTAIKPSE